MAPLVDAFATVSDAGLLRQLAALFAAHGMEVEPSAAAGLAGMEAACADPEGWRFVRERGAGTGAQVAWATGGRLVPEAEHAAFREKAARVAESMGGK
jgi:D-serine dehydratase